MKYFCAEQKAQLIAATANPPPRFRFRNVKHNKMIINQFISYPFPLHLDNNRMASVVKREPSSSVATVSFVRPRFNWLQLIDHFLKKNT